MTESKWWWWWWCLDSLIDASEEYDGLDAEEEPSGLCI
jgi:hypothetical protein